MGVEKTTSKLLEASKFREMVKKRNFDFIDLMQITEDGYYTIFTGI
jgi:hypothetical protein